jgi:hypothetical protein
LDTNADAFDPKFLGCQLSQIGFGSTNTWIQTAPA